MECRDVRPRLPALIDGHLPAPEAAAVQAHLAACPACQRLERQYRQDLYDLARYLRTAPWRPIEQRPWAAPRPARGFWGAVAVGGHRLAAGAALVALLALVTAAALALRGMATTPGAGPTPTAESGVVATSASPVVSGATSPEPPLLGPPRASQLMDDLARAGLAFAIDRTEPVGSQTVTVRRLAADRFTTYLEYSATAGDLNTGHVMLIDDRGQELRPTIWWSEPASAGSGIPAAASVTWVEFPGLDPDVRGVTVRFSPPQGDPVEVRVQVDLAPLRALPAPWHVRAATTVNGVKAELLTITRGMVVSAIDWRAVPVDPKAVIPMDGGGSLDEHVLIEANGERLPILRHTRIGEDDWYVRVWVYQLPKTGQLHLRLDRVAVSGLSGGYTTVRGPWEFTLDLADPGAQGPATPPPSPQPAGTPVPTPAPSPTPSAPAVSLPADLYFVGKPPNGVLALWRQPADGSAPRLVVQGKADLDAFWPVPDTNQIAVRFADNPAVWLATADGALLEPATMPDGQPVAEYVASPDGARIAYVSLDRRSLWVSNADGSNLALVHQVRIPEAQTIHQVSWAPRGYTLRYEVAQFAAGSRAVVAVVGGPDQTVDPVTRELARDALAYAWSPGGTELAYSTYSGIYRVRIADGVETAITPPALRDGTQRALVNLHWLRDGRIAVVAHQDGTVYSPADLWLMNSDGSDAWRAVRDLGPVEALRWAPTGDGFVLTTVGGQGLTWYASIHAEPVPLAEDVTLGDFSRLAWAGG
ncbi:MAG: zf-HC2 domain-containing protein [Sphaerobacter sp.]|nr:zf-HC2 domain-containing protein [Sphaerobacter sp.]